MVGGFLGTQKKIGICMVPRRGFVAGPKDGTRAAAAAVPVRESKKELSSPRILCGCGGMGGGSSP